MVEFSSEEAYQMIKEELKEVKNVVNQFKKDEEHF